ncbi:MAG: phage tail protein [Saprospiraceae bacterium]|nr:phage tail protein [Saprospiraceae bacterium]
MATSTNIIRGKYPLPVYNYRVTIDNEPHGFSEVSGLNIQYEAITYKHGLSWREGPVQMPGMSAEVKITLKRGLVRARSFLLQWLESARRHQVVKHDLTIDLCDEQGTPVVSWKIINAFPLKLEAPSLNSDSNELAVESIELLAAGIAMTFH